MAVEDSADDAALAEELAGRAGELLLALRAGDPEAADDRSDAWLNAELARRRPGDAVLSEESPDPAARLSAARVWIVDPLDGTREYREPGRTDWAVHVALWVGGHNAGGHNAGGHNAGGHNAGHLAAGVVALPALGEVWTTARPKAEIAERVRRIAVSRTRAPEWAAPVAAELGARLVPMGSAGAKVAAVLRGDVDAYLHGGGQYEWDSAAPVAVALAAGLHASRVDGGPMAYNQPDPWCPDLLVCPPARAREITGLVARFRKTMT